MKKIILILILIVIILIAGTPYLFGIKAEQNYNQFLNQINDTGTVKVEKRSYNRGFFSSKANSTLSLVNGSRNIKFFISDTIHHGPFDYSKIIGGNFDLKPFLATSDSDIKADIPVTTSNGTEKTISIKMSGNTIIDINQILDSKIIIPHYKFIKSNDNVVVNWSGLEMNTKYNLKTNYLSSTLASKLLSVENKDTYLSLKNLNGSSSAIGHDDKLNTLTGEYEINIGELNFSSPEDRWSLQNVKFTGYSKKDNDKLNSGLKIVTDKISLGNNTTGSFNTEINLNNLDYKAYSRFQELTKTSKTENPEGNYMQNLFELLPDLLKHSPSLEIPNLSLLTNIGNLKASASVKINADNPKLLQNIFLIGTAIDASANLTISKSLMDFIMSNEMGNKKIDNSVSDTDQENLNKMKIKQLVDTNILTTDSNNYIFRANMKNGNLTVNNQPLAVNPMLLNPNQ